MSVLEYNTSLLAAKSSLLMLVILQCNFSLHLTCEGAELNYFHGTLLSSRTPAIDISLLRNSYPGDGGGRRVLMISEESCTQWLRVNPVMIEMFFWCKLLRFHPGESRDFPYSRFMDQNLQLQYFSYFYHKTIPAEAIFLVLWS